MGKTTQTYVYVYKKHQTEYYDHFIYVMKGLCDAV